MENRDGRDRRSGLSSCTPSVPELVMYLVKFSANNECF